LEWLKRRNTIKVVKILRAECEAAIGDREHGNPRPQWAGFNDINSAKKHLKGIEVMSQALLRTQRALQRTAALNQPPPPANEHQQVYIFKSIVYILVT
jgi:hypothetical protein